MGVVETRPSDEPGKGRCLGGCCGCLLVLLVAAFFGGLSLVRTAIQAQIVASLNKDLAAAERWDVDCRLFAPLQWLAGQPADLKITGRNARFKEFITAREVDINVRDLTVDRQAGQVKSISEATFGIGFTGEELSAALARQAAGMPAADTLKVSIANGKIEIAVKVPVGPTRLDAKAVASPKVLPPDKFKLQVEDLQLGAIPGFGGQGKAAAIAALSRLLTVDIGSDLKGVTLTSAVVENDLLKVRGSIDPQVLRPSP